MGRRRGAARRIALQAACGAWLAAALCTSAPAEVSFAKADWLRLYGDFRFRLESDWDSQTANGTPRADRDRARIRARLGLRFLPTDVISIDLRVRTGSLDSQQSGFATVYDFDGNPRGDHDLLLDRWALKFKQGSTWAWAGRDDFPFWKQNEMLWDDDATLAGAAAGHDLALGRSKLSIRAGYFTVPDGGIDFLGNLGAGQVVWSRPSDRVLLTAAAGLYVLDGEPGAQQLRNGNGARDYTLGVASFQAQWTAGDRPLALGADVLFNVHAYDADDPDPFTAANRDQRTGYVVQAAWGGTRAARDWLVAYYYAHIESLSVNASFAEDDLVRWGSATQTDGSDLSGHEFRVGYGLRKDMDLLARLYLADAITSVQDGKRFRIDFTWRL